MQINRSIAVALLEVSSILPYYDVYGPQRDNVINFQKHLRLTMDQRQMKKKWLNFDLKWLKIETISRSRHFLVQF